MATTGKPYLNMNEACARLGITLPTLRQALRRLEIKTYGSALDHRAKVIRAEDVDRIERVRSGQEVVIGEEVAIA